MKQKIELSHSAPDAENEHTRAVLAAINKLLAPFEPKKRTWRGLKRDRVLAYLRGITRKSKHIWTWINARKVAACLSKDSEQSVSEKTVWRVLSNLAEREQTPSKDPQLCVRVCQRETKKNRHFQWLISSRDKLAYDGEPLFLRADGKSRNLRLRCRKKNLPDTRTKTPTIVYQQKRESTPPGPPPPASPQPAPSDNSWKRLVPDVEQLFHRLGIPTYKRGDTIWAHSPWKREADKTPSCQIFPAEGRFWDYSTGQGGNAITLARIANGNPKMSFREALLWLQMPGVRPSVPSAWYQAPTKVAARDPFAQMLENLKIGGGKKLPTQPRGEGLYRLAWRIYREQFQGVIVNYLNPRGVVTLIVKALERKGERAAIEEAIQWAIQQWKKSEPFFSQCCRFQFRSMREKRWRHRDLRQASCAEDFSDMLALAQFLNDLRRALDRSFYPAKASPVVERNKTPEAITMCQAQIRAMFRSNEHIWITNSLRHRGWCRTAEYWLDDIAKHGVPTGEEGAWLKLNPMSQFGISNQDVHHFRHVLCEADTGTIEEQIRLSETLPYPIVSAVHSGSKSIHFLLRVNAEEKSYAAIVKELHAQYPQFDQACKDPARWTRLAGACRAGVLQAALPLGRMGL